MNKKIVGILIIISFVLTIMIPAMGIMGMMNKKTSIIQSNTQGSIEVWNRTYGGEGDDLLYFIEETNDGGFIALGWTEENNGAYSAWMLKLNLDGDKEWEIKELTNYNFIQASDLEQTSDGGYIACGYQAVYDGYEGFLWKVDKTGSTEWIKSYTERLWNIQKIDNGYICLGWVPISSNNYGFALLNVDILGTVQWNKVYDYGDDDEYGYSLCKTKDDGYLLGGYATLNNQPDFWMVKTDSDGNKEWDKIHGGADIDMITSRNCFQTNNGGYISAGVTESFGAGRTDMWLLKTDENGDMLWNKTFGESTRENCYSMDISHDNGYVMCGAKNYGGFSGSRGDVWIIKTDDKGNIEKSQTFGGSKEDRGYYISKTSDGGYIISGFTKSFGNGGEDAWVIKLSSFSNKKPSNPSTSYDKKNDELILSAIDPDGDKVKYGISWVNDNTIDHWTELVESGTELQIDCEDKTGTVGVISEDEYGAQSDWVLQESVNKIPNPFIRLIERFPFLEPYLEIVLN